MITTTNKQKTKTTKPPKQALAKAEQELKTLVDEIATGAAAPPATPAVASSPLNSGAKSDRGHRVINWASTCTPTATWWCGRSMAARPNLPNASAPRNSWNGPKSKQRWPSMQVSVLTVESP
ncbi:MAG: hypothetical protein ABI651_11325 [Verrucomicrobiota bacterium]